MVVASKAVSTRSGNPGLDLADRRCGREAAHDNPAVSLLYTGVAPHCGQQVLEIFGRGNPHV